MIKKRYESRRAFRFIYLLSIIIFGMLTSFGSGCGGGNSGNGGGSNGLVLPASTDVPRAVDQFLSLQHHGDPLAFGYIHLDLQQQTWVDVGDDPRECKHYQGIVRVNGPDGTPYFILSRSGNDTLACSGAGDDPGELLIVKMGSRDKDGERLRSNRLQRDNDTGSTYPDVVNWPNLRDHTVKSIHLDLSEDCTWVSAANQQVEADCPSWKHPGGMQVVDNVLFLAVENGYYQAKKSGIVLIDVSDPENPVFIDEITTMLLDIGWGPTTIDIFEGKTGLIAVTREPGSDNYLIALSGGSYDRSNALLFLEMDSAPPYELRYLSSWDAGTLLPDGDDDAWRCGRDCVALTLNYQTLNFIRDESDNLFLIGLDNDTVGTTDGYDYAKMFWVQRSGNSFTLTYMAEKHLRLSDPNMGDLDAASGVYVSPTGQLIIYTADHDNEGPSWIRNSLEMGEFRSIMVSHTETCGPQWRGGDPSQHIGGPYAIDEGETLQVDGTLWFIEPWVHLFEEQLWIWTNPYSGAGVPINSGGRGLMMDWRGNHIQDWPAWSDDYDDLDRFNFGDKAEALIWCGVPGSSIWLFGEDYFGRPLQMWGGTGNNRVEINLAGYLDGDIDSVMLYWDGPSSMEYNWQLSAGASGALSDINTPIVTYQAGCGSDTDTLILYLNQDQWTAQTTINVNGVDPSIAGLNTSGSGQEGSLITLLVTWDDPCATSVDALINWGDGAVNTLPAVSKVFQSAHTYSDNGTYPINVSIVDAGGGQDSGSLAPTVVNVPPSVNAGLDWTINTGDTLDFQATFTDPGINDTHTATIDWGDGTNSPGLVTESNGSGTVTGSHTYSIPNNYMVTSTVTDDDGGVGTDTASVEVINQLPVAVCNDVIIIADNNCQGDASVDGGSYDPDENPITIHQSPEGPYGLGLTMVTLIVSDSYGASDSCTGTVTVVDTTPPSIVDASASPDLLWPPNHQLSLVKLAVSTSDNCDATPVCNVLSVTSNEPGNASGDGNTAEDWEITGNLAVNLRAECSGNSNGRVYTVELICSDIAGNSSTGAVSVNVPHDQLEK